MLPEVAVFIAIVAQGALADKGWVPLSASARAGEIEVGVVAVSLGQARLKNSAGAFNVSQDPMLQLRLHIRNLSPTREIRYKGWAMKPTEFVGKLAARLRDDVGNNYSPVRFIGGASRGQIEGKTIAPAGFAEDVLAFELPAPEAKELWLTLPGRAVGSLADFRIAILLADVTPEPETEVLPTNHLAEPLETPQTVTAPSESLPTTIPSESVPQPVIDDSEDQTEVETDSRGRLDRLISGFDDMGPMEIAFVTFVIIVYFSPMAIGFLRSHHNAASIAVLNLFLGWTFIGWAVALAIAVSALPSPRRDRTRRFHRPGPW